MSGVLFIAGMWLGSSIAVFTMALMRASSDR